MSKMTLEQQKLVEDNINLIYYACYKFGYNVQDYFDIGAIALCNSAIKYNENLGYKFSTYAIKSIHQKFQEEYRDSKAKKRIPNDKLVHYDKVMNDENNTKNNTYLENFICNDINYDNIIAEELIDKIKKKLSTKPSKYRIVFNLLIQEYSITEIRKIIQEPKSTIDYIVRYIRNLVEKEIKK